MVKGLLLKAFSWVVPGFLRLPGRGVISYRDWGVTDYSARGVTGYRARGVTGYRAIN